ncbi:MAG: T9SS type A sorting domain-containing protein [Saprospiraceae bacterium]
MKSLFLLFTALFLGTHARAQNCNPDISAPTAACRLGLTAELGQSFPGATNIYATDLDLNSSDSCTSLLDFRIELGNTPSGTPPAAISHLFTAVGTYDVIMWVGDESNNWSTCQSVVEITEQTCMFDTAAPVAICNLNILVNQNNGSTEVINAEEIDDGSYDNCTSDLQFRLQLGTNPLSNPPFTTSLTFGAPGNYPVTLWVADDSLNWNTCHSEINIVNTNCDDNASAPIAICAGGITVELGLDGPGETVLWASDFDEGSWDQCSPVHLTLEIGTMSSGTVPEDESITLTEIGNFFAFLWVADTSGNTNICWSELQVIPKVNCTDQFVSGTVFLDTLTVNCLPESGENGLENWQVTAIGQETGREYIAFTDALGNYTLGICYPDSVVEVSLDVPINYGQTCQSLYTVQLTLGDTAQQDIPVQLNNFCPLLSVDISAPILRRCFSNTYYVNACNLSTQSVDDVTVAVDIDPAFEVTGSNLPGAALGNNQFEFNLGVMAPGECQTIELYGTLDCSTPLGVTHCSEAHITPDTLCGEGSAWSGADVRVKAVCDGDSVRMEIKNQGIGNMNETLDFIVVEDVIMYNDGNFQLNTGESMEITVPANGSTWYLSAEQATDHPYGGPESIALEGCGGINSTGLVNQFALGSPNPFNSVVCIQNVGSYDPNDKQAWPTGYGQEHWLKPNTPINYQIRFQNTGTDTAFTVVVLDTLSSALDPFSVRPGASSHPYQFSIIDGNILRFRFDNIMLPDSNVNEVASHGFIKFGVDQLSDNPDGTIIENRAGIYFDFNDAVMTNTVFHTIGEHFVTVALDNPKTASAIKAYPNPSSDRVFFEVPESARQFELLNLLGQRISLENINQSPFVFDKKNLNTGTYIFRIHTEKGETHSGKIILE